LIRIVARMALEPKYIRALPPIVVAERQIKRYHVSNSETPIAAAIEHAAYAMLPQLLPAWELPPFGHERSAWVRHLLDTDQPDLDAYLADTMADGVAGPAN
jgi:hypothetical protein